MLKVLAQAFGPSTAATPGDFQASCRALEKCVGGPTRFSSEVRCVNTRCATAVRIFFDHEGYVAHLAREVGPASPEAGFRAHCCRPLLTTAAQADNLLVLPLLPFTQEPSGWTGVGFFLLKNIFFEILRLIIFLRGLQACF